MTAQISQLKKNKSQSLGPRLFLGKYDENEILKQIKELLAENEKMKEHAKGLEDNLQYQKKRENKLIYFLSFLQ